MSGPTPTRHGHDAYEAISALQKACRRSQPEQAAYWAIELAVSGHGWWLWKRLKVIAVEDVSTTATGLVADVAALHEQWRQNKGDDLLAVVRAAVALAIAPKGRLIDWLVLLYGADDAPRCEVPSRALDMHTRRGKQMGRGKQHFLDEASRLVEWDGDLSALEADVRQRAAAVWLDDRPRRKTSSDEQMTLSGEEER